MKEDCYRCNLEGFVWEVVGVREEPVLEKTFGNDMRVLKNVCGKK